MEVYKYTWKQFHQDCNLLLKKIVDEQFNSLAGIAFGGLPLVTYLKNTLKIPTRVVFASSYTGQKHKDLKIKLGDLDKLVAPVLIIDDIIDSGITLLTVKNYLLSKNIEHKIAVLFYKPDALFKPDYFIHKTDKWVQFPWE
jgi:hypoxanthine phosphoribosyltransferase